ncbi:SH3 domain-containing protein 19-like isoform X2 [Poecilia formosa]|uniref:SH3 domain-containing protein 19-like isoform X2 n=1 Tax=Poecilia formosa TaxID=48698 RepID=UPI0007B926BF|nr:PREDICTED: SH3 domain-containing protein 19-like isoform X2 [Poecilia formosa]
MAEARSEEEEENLRRDTRDQVVRRQPNSSGGRPDRRKPEHRHSQGPLSSIRAVIKRTSRSTTVSETHRDRERDRDRDRRRPEITILAAEPLPSTSWFPGAVGGIPPPPPPPAQIWGPTIAPTIQPPPSYEEVIREKTQEQVLHPPAPSSSSSPSVCRTTIATQTDPGPAADPQETRDRRSARPPRPPPPSCTSRPPNAADVIITSSQSTVGSSEADSVATNTHPEPLTHTSTHTQCSDFLSDQQLPSASALPDPSPDVPLERPRPRPRTRLARQPISDEVKVQTLVKLREDGLATLAARTASDATNPEGSNGKYLQELLEAFSSDDWGIPDHRSDDSERSQSESEDGAEEEDMATLRARIQAFEQQVADESCGDLNTGNVEGFVVTKRPEPRPRPRLQGQPAKSTPPVIAPKPKSFSPSPKPSSKVFWEDEGVAVESGSVETAESNPEAPSSAEASKSDPGSDIKPSQSPEKPATTPKPQTVTEPLPSSAPVPAPRPPPPKLTSSISSDSFALNPGPPKRPPVAPRASLGAPPQSGGEATQNTVTQAGGSIRSTVKPAAPTSPRRGSAPSLAPKPTAVPPARPDPNPVPLKAAAVSPAAPTKPPGPPKPPTPAPAPAMRKASVPPAKAEASIPANPASAGPTLPQRPPSVKLLPLRPPPIKSAPSRPPPPAINSSTNQIAAAKAEQFSSANQMQTQRVSKKGPPLPPRPKPGHPLFSSYMKQEVLIVLDDPNPAPAESQQAGEGTDQSGVTADTSPSQCLLDLDTQPETVQHQDGESKTAIEDLNPSDFQSILPVQPAELKEQPDPPAVSGPRCVALFDYEGEDDDELTFSQGDVIGLLELVGEEWARGQIHGRTGIFPLNFMEVVEPLPQPTPGETSKQEAAESGETESSATLKQPSDVKTDEWVVALFDFPGQTAEDLSFQKGALIQVTEHVDAEWRRGRLDGREGLFPAAFTQLSQAQPITGQESAAKGTAKAVFDFTAENEDELTLKVGDVLTQVEPVDEQWILGVVGGKRGIVPKNYISFL